MRRSIAALLFAVSTASPLACSVGAEGPEEEEERAAATSAGIENGAADSADVSTVALTFGGAVYCSGTLVAPRVVVTAAHCVVFRAPDGALFDTSNGRAIVAVAASVAHPSFDLATLTDDIAVVELAADAPVGAVAMVDREGPAAGADVRVVGFGVPRGSSTSPARRAGEARLGEVRLKSFTTTPTPGQPCSDDSGGSAYVRVGDRLLLAGVISAGDADCARYAIHTRVDAYVDFITPFLSPAPNAAGGCAIAPARRRTEKRALR